MKQSSALDQMAASIPWRSGLPLEPSYRLVAEAIPQLVWAADNRGRCTYLNSRFSEYTGLAFEEAQGSGWLQALHPDDRPRNRERFRHAASTGESFEIEYRFRSGSDGSYRWFLGRALPIRDDTGRIAQWIGTCTDIHGQRCAQELLEIKARAGRELDASLDYRTNLRRVARLIVPAYADWCAIDLLEEGAVRRVVTAAGDAATERRVDAFAASSPAGLDDPHGVGRVLRTGEPEFYRRISDEMLVQTARSEEQLAQLRSLGLDSVLCLPIIARGRILGTLSLTYAGSGRLYEERDVEPLQELANRAGMAIENARLVERLRHDIEEIRKAEQEKEALIAALARSNRDLDQFAYVASHDLKAPLRGIAHLSQWIEEDLGEHVTDGVRDHLRLLQNRAHRMEALIEGILSYSRAGRKRAKVEEVGVGALLDEVLGLLPLQENVKVEIGEGMPTLRTDRTQLSQVFLNLIGNALKHGRVEAPLVRIEARAVDERFHEFAVSDNGPGIDPAYHARIWGIFQQLEARDRIEGTGIGLAVVKRIVESRGGQVQVESSEGQGATFRFSWPRDEEA